MDENLESQGTAAPVVEETQTSSTPSVSFPTISNSGKSGSNLGKVILVISILAIVGVLGFFIFRGSQTAAPSPIPESIIQGSGTPIPTQTPSVGKSKIQIEIQNGTGIAGEAAYLQDQLKSLGYSDIKIGNSTSQDNTTTVVTFSNKAPQSVVDEITAKLQEIYKSVQTKTSSIQTSDVLIVTGLRKGQTPRPSEVPTAAPTTTPAASPTATPKATP